MTQEWRVKYERHIRSSQWCNVKRDMIRLRGERCGHCGFRYELQLHHKTYERLGRELISDLELLCERCHKAADKKREQESAARSADAMYAAGLDTFASKKYGDNWQTWANEDDEERICSEFDEWLERKERREGDYDDYGDDHGDWGDA
jgi:hypothetical protein